MMIPPPPGSQGVRALPSTTQKISYSLKKSNQCNLLVIEADGNDWKREFENRKLGNGTQIKVTKTAWSGIHIEAEGGRGEAVSVCRIIDEGEELEFTPNFVLFRAFPNDIFGYSFRRQVLGLVFSGIDGVNSVSSVLRSMDRPVVHAEMLRIAEKLGHENFPVIPAKYHPNGYSGNKKRLIPLEFPTVIKVGSSYGGYGKMIAHNKGEYDDIISLLAMGTEYFTEEPMIKHDYEYRIQVIGPYVRCFRRNSHNNWKNQCGNVTFTDHPWLPRYEKWVDAVRSIFGGMDMFGIDVLHSGPLDSGKDYILEINDSAMGFDSDYEPEDRKWVRELVIQRMNEKFCGFEKKSYLGIFIESKYKRGDLKGITFLD